MKEKRTPDLNHDQTGRRRLLKMAAYVPPAILGVMVAGQEEAHAAGTFTCNGGTYAVSAAGNACCPCVRNPTSNNCLKERCKLLDCPSCQALFAAKNSQKKCAKVAAACGCTCSKTGGTWGCN